MAFLRWLISGHAVIEAPDDWLAVRAGDIVPDERGRPATVRSLAIFEVHFPDTPAGERSFLALIWAVRDDKSRGRLVERDVYPEDADVELHYRFEPAGLDGRPGFSEEASDRVTLLEASGPDAGACPSSGWAMRDGDLSVLFSEDGTPRLAVRTRAL